MACHMGIQFHQPLQTWQMLTKSRQCKRLFFGTPPAQDAPLDGGSPTATPQKKGKGKGKGKDKSTESTANKDAPPAPPANKEFEGTLKSLSKTNGYGFIQCDEIRRIYDRDVWVDSGKLVENVKVSDQLRFTISLSAKGHPQAQHLKVIAPGNAGQ